MWLDYNMEQALFVNALVLERGSGAGRISGRCSSSRLYIVRELTQSEGPHCLQSAYYFRPHSLTTSKGSGAGPELQPKGGFKQVCFQPGFRGFFRFSYTLPLCSDNLIKVIITLQMMLAGPVHHDLSADRHLHGTELLYLTRSKPMVRAKSVRPLSVALELVIG
jgi:hypothetical protein